MTIRDAEQVVQASNYASTALTESDPALEVKVAAVGGSPVTVPLDNTYTSPVVVCSVQYSNNTIPVVPRVSNVGSTSFDVRLQNPSDGTVQAENVSCIVVEEGIWTIDGVKLEAQKYLSTVTDHDSSWVGQPQSYGQSYSNPVVIGQVMSENDPGWSAFWCRGSSAEDPPSATSLNTGKNVAEDSDITRENETVGFIVFETGHNTIGGVEFEAFVGASSIQGVDDSPPYSYNFNTAFAASPEVRLVALAGMNGPNGGWAQVHGSTGASSTSLYLSVDEDQIGDTERNHIAEQVGCVVFDSDTGTGPVITIAGTPLSAFSTQPGTSSAVQSYRVSGRNLTNNITVNAPADFQVSLLSDSGFASSLTLNQSGGSVPETTIYVLFSRPTEGSSSGNITHASTGAVTRSVAVSGTAAPLAPVDLNILLGRPADDSITANIIPDQDVEFYLEYGTSPGSYPSQTPTYNAIAEEPIEFVIDELAANTEYFYHIAYRQAGTTEWNQGPEYSFITQRPPGSTFVFTIISDSHLGQYGGQTADELALYETTLQNVAADNPDFHIDLGDSSAMDPSPLGTGMTEEEADAAYYVQRPYLGEITHSIPFYLVIGNHENEEGWNFDDVFTPPDQSLAIVGMKYRKLYFPNPIPDDFYTGNTDPLDSPIGGDTNHEDYYAWEWGDALFVVLDPYHYSLVWPADNGDTYGGEGQDGETQGDRWDWSLGIQQYLWLKDVLETSTATYKFVFSHHVTGGNRPYGRGGILAAPYFEWGGYNYNYDDPSNPVDWAWDTERPASEGWDVPIHQLMVENGVDIYFHGHDHMYAYEELDDIVYLECPKPDDAGYTWEPYGYGYTEGHYPDALAMIPNSGHIRVTVSPTGVKTEYVRSYLPGDGTNGYVEHTVIVDNPATTYDLTMQVSPAEGGTTTPAVGSHTYNADEVVDISASPTSGYEFDDWEGDVADPNDPSTTVTMNANKTITARFTQFSPEAFIKTSPTDTATGISTDPTLEWGTSTYADSYQYCIDTTDNDTCDGDAWQANGASTSAALNGLVTDTNYYWQVQAVNEAGTTGADTDTWWSFRTNVTPDQPTLVQPDDGAPAVPIPPTLEVTVNDPDGDTLDVTFYGRPLGESNGEDFTLIALPDTQFYSQSYPSIFAAQTEWIAANETAENILFVTHLGDIVNTANSETQWINADAAMDVLDPTGIPYSVGPGNHDLPIYTSPSYYNTYFGTTRFASKTWFTGHYESDNYNNYSFFSASGMDFILINLQYDPPTAMLDWADALLKANSSRRGIVVSHSMLNTNDTFTTEGTTIFNALRDNPNLFLMLCGHMHSVSDGAAYRSEQGEDGHTIHIMMADYQDFPSGGNGYLRILRFSPAQNTIYASTYSPYLNTYITTYSDQMEMTYSMLDTAQFEVIDTVNAVGSGTNASITWFGLEHDTEYEWYVDVSDGSATAISPTWSFTTEPAGTCSITWEADISVQDNGAGSNILTFGQGTTATDGLDTACGEIRLPPKPPAGSYDARFALPIGSDASIRDYRNDSLTDIEWRMEFQPGTGGYPFSFTWNPAALPAGAWRMYDPFEVLVDVDMKAENSYTLTSQDIDVLIIEYHQPVCLEVSVVAGWNMTSVPVLADVMTLVDLYPDVSPPAYYFTNAYQPVGAGDELAPGVGYWTYFNEPHTYQVCGAVVETKDIPVNAGWNMIGPFEVPASVAAIPSDPAGILDPPVYGFSSSYYEVTTLVPAAGYWVYATQAGTLHMGTVGSSAVMTPAQDLPVNWLSTGLPVYKIHLPLIRYSGAASQVN